MTAPQPANACTETTRALPHRRERRPVTLAACATREDGSLVEMTIVDLSYDGCGVVCSGAVAVGDRLNLSALGRKSAPVTVRWTDGGRAGLSFIAVAGEDEPTRQPRRHERVSVEGEVTMHRRNKSNYRVHIYDLSPEGCRAEFVERPDVNEQLWIKFDGLEHLAADVRWIVGAKAGLKFQRSFHPAVFELLIARLTGAV